MEEQPFPKEITYMDTAFNALVYLDVIYVFIVISCLTFYKMKIEMAMKHCFRPYRSMIDTFQVYSNVIYIKFDHIKYLKHVWFFGKTLEQSTVFKSHTIHPPDAKT